MPVFQAHLPADRFTSEQKRALGAALPQALNDALGIPAEDQFVTINTHSPDELFLDPSYGDVQRTQDAVIITVLFTAERPLADKRALVQAIAENASVALGIGENDVFIALVPVPRENFSFGHGRLQLAPDVPLA
ncbi:hypothetical protein Csp1_01010 [Corynebacterium provencense]|uniref:4-oxalocrotonate tautomerase domain-containing protein n=1 Tax=Corynebacterium provencense TaxID=1737425 RepID=A0A2Z3YMS0_9CORY|nr:tautomerase family protein [Corynebacterium provencense]AWT24929.1 hypothetical protein Csp1_01010 [Corynebacterium provencense]